VDPVSRAARRHGRRDVLHGVQHPVLQWLVLAVRWPGPAVLLGTSSTACSNQGLSCENNLCTQCGGPAAVLRG